jgi:uncharacterized protein
VHFDNEFVVDAPVDRVWEHLLDVERVAPCVPGAQLTEVVDERTWKGLVKVKIGPVSLSFAGTVALEERDDASHKAFINAKGMEQRGKGAATAEVRSWLEALENGTRVMFSTDLTISGAAAQYGRGMLEDISQRMANEFARCIQSSLESEETELREAAGQTTTPAVSRPVKGIRLGLWALWRALVRAIGRLFGRRGDRGS